MGNETLDKKLKGKAGYADWTAKRICLDEDNLKKDKNSLENLHLYANDVLRHEIVHAFIEESGLSDQYQNETIVEWIAKMAPKILECANTIVFTEKDIVNKKED
jgi:hypothetical protein